MRSVFLWRLLIVLMITVFFASLFMMGGYLFLSRDAYRAIKLSELMPDVETVVQMLSERRSGDLSAYGFDRMMARMVDSSNSMCVLLDENGKVVNYYCDKTIPVVNAEQIERLFQREISDVLAGYKVHRENLMLPDGSNAMGVGQRVEYGEEVAGAVLFLKSAQEVNATTGQLNLALMMAAAVVFPVSLILSTVGLRKVTNPLHRMGEAAIEMSKGDFEIRADETEAGEVGLLARALNTLCDNLSKTIYQLRAEKSQLNQILLSFTEGIAATDSLGFLTHYNPALMRLFGAVRVNSRTDLVPDESIWAAFDAVYESGEGQSMQYPLPGDRMLWITISPVTTEDGIRTGVVGLFKDMTEMERLERTRREYVANVSHEMRTPLTAVRGLLEPLVDGMVKTEEDRERYYKIMLREVLRLSRLITDMLELSRLLSGTGYMEMTEVDVNGLLSDIVQSYGKQASEHGVELRLDAPPLPSVLTDPDRVEQVLVILLDNAMRYTPEGGTITIRAQNGPRVNIAVEDTGYGIPPEDIPHLFERFYKVDKSRKEGGTGLGLSIAQFVIEKLGEKIMVESEIGKGTSFRFTLKKYVVNAIQLGPALDDWSGTGVIEISPEEVWAAESKTEVRPEDAPYEVLPEEEKAAKEKAAKEKAAKEKAAKEKAAKEKAAKEKAAKEKAAKEKAEKAAKEKAEREKKEAMRPMKPLMIQTKTAETPKKRPR